MILPFTISLLLFTAADLLWTDGWKKELSKLLWLAFGFTMLYLPFSWLLIVSWCLVHYTVHQCTLGAIRHGNPFYLGNGSFDLIIRFICGQPYNKLATLEENQLRGWSIGMYGLSLSLSMFIGMDLMFKIFSR